VASEDIHSVLALPIRVSEQSAYVLVLHWKQSYASDPAFFAMVQRFADQAGLALERAEVERLHARLEKSLLPRSRFLADADAITLLYRPGEDRLGVGGDFVDYLPSARGGLSMVVGDVSGHGPDAAALGALLRSSWHALALTGVGLEKTAQVLNEVLLHERMDDDVYCTVLLAELSPGRRNLTLLVAGHPPALLLTDKAAFLEAAAAPPLGFESLPYFRTTSFILTPPWTVLLYTDGLVEGRVSPGSRERFGVERLRSRLAEELPAPVPGSALERLFEEVHASNGGKLPDDVAALIVSDGLPGPLSRSDGQAPGEEFCRRLVLPPDLSLLTQCRALVEEVGELVGLSAERIFDFKVAVSEACSNAMEHAGESGEVRVTAWRFWDRLTFEVWSASEFQPGLSKDTNSRRRGLGLPLMASLTDQVHVSRPPEGGTLVSLTMRLTSEPRGAEFSD
jgi:serine phosphatase RsbU (regulator of sigma subunit)/anti-sigma regulatory factor (Ser/Thr protein kinase)